mmetsp:Transcript_23339/g.71492  ORF Transcript_23339/g.71492 Transcript_23339/m.71492 type:complete len:144 (+) Transcript_23339:124-555(+)
MQVALESAFHFAPARHSPFLAALHPAAFRHALNTNAHARSLLGTRSFIRPLRLSYYHLSWLAICSTHHGTEVCYSEVAPVSTRPRPAPFCMFAAQRPSAAQRTVEARARGALPTAAANVSPPGELLGAARTIRPAASSAVYPV